MKKECMVLNENKNQNESRNYKLLDKIWWKIKYKILIQFNWNMLYI